jgi:hypothetical protein
MYLYAPPEAPTSVRFGKKHSNKQEEMAVKEKYFS